jgi:glutathione S-transferase
MITLFEHPLSPYAQKCKIVLGEKAIAFEAKLPEAFGTGATPDERFKAGNPRHEVPSLLDGDVTIYDSTVILEYLEDKYPNPPMLPVGAGERARVRMLEDVMDTQYEAINWGIMEVGAFKRATGELGQALLARAADQTAGMQAWLESQLGSREWFNGDGFGWGDAAVVPHLNTSVRSGNAPKPGSRLAEWLARCNARPSVAAVNQAVTDIMKVMPRDLSQMMAMGFRRQYRDHRLEWMMRSGGVSVVLEGLEKNTLRFSNEVL